MPSPHMPSPAPPADPRPFDDRAWEIGELTVESAADVVAIHGSLDIRQDQEGLLAARRLRDYLVEAVRALEEKNSRHPLPERDALQPPERGPNPFV